MKPTDWRGSRRTNTVTSDKSLIRRSAVSVTGREACLPVVDNSAALKPSSQRAHCHIDTPITDHVAGDEINFITSIEILQSCQAHCLKVEAFVSLNKNKGDKLSHSFLILRTWHPDIWFIVPDGLRSLFMVVWKSQSHHIGDHLMPYQKPCI